MATPPPTPTGPTPTDPIRQVVHGRDSGVKWTATYAAPCDYGVDSQHTPRAVRTQGSYVPIALTCTTCGMSASVRRSVSVTSPRTPPTPAVPAPAAPAAEPAELQITLDPEVEVDGKSYALSSLTNYAKSVRDSPDAGIAMMAHAIVGLGAKIERLVELTQHADHVLAVLYRAREQGALTLTSQGLEMDGRVFLSSVEVATLTAFGIPIEL